MSDAFDSHRLFDAPLDHADAVDVARGALLCARCRAPVTRRESAIEVAGAHRHTRVNPHGDRFTFGLYAQAPGCESRGASTVEHSWFPPRPWRYAHCAGCAIQLGWQFDDRAGDAFHALIDECLIEGDADE